MTDSEQVETAEATPRRRRTFGRRGPVALSVAGVVVVTFALWGTAAYAQQRAQDAVTASQARAVDAIATCTAGVDEARDTLVVAYTAINEASAVADRVATELDAVSDVRTALRDATSAACDQVVSTSIEGNDQVVIDASADASQAKQIAVGLQTVVDTLTEATTAAHLEVATETLSAVTTDAVARLDAATALAVSLAGQVSDQATLDALLKGVADAQALVDAAPATDVDGLNAATKALNAALVAVDNAAAGANTSHQAWADAQAAATTAASSNGSSGGRTSSGNGSSGGGSSSGGSTGGSTGGGATGGGGAGVITWSTCDGSGQFKYVDGEWTGVGRSCTTVAFASAAVAPYQNPGNGTCAVVATRTSDSTNALVSKASEYTYGRFTFIQANETQVKMTIESCLAP